MTHLQLHQLCGTQMPTITFNRGNKGTHKRKTSDMERQIKNTIRINLTYIYVLQLSQPRERDIRVLSQLLLSSSMSKWICNYLWIDKFELVVEARLNLPTPTDESAKPICIPLLKSADMQLSSDSSSCRRSSSLWWQ